jgi:hypothetical protein
LYSINLTTGTATQIGTTPIGGTAPLLIGGLAVAPPGAFEFSAPTYSSARAAPVATIHRQPAPRQRGLATVTLSTADGTATAPADYTDSTQTLIFAPASPARPSRSRSPTTTSTRRPRPSTSP